MRLRKILWTTAVSLTIAAALALPAGAAVVYDNIPSPQPGNVLSVAYEANGVSEWGGQIQLAQNERQNPVVTVLMSSWGCQSGHWFSNDCSTTPGATFPVSITLKLYNVGAGGSVGSLITTTTQAFNIPYRPSRDPVNCSTTPGLWFSASDATCYNGFATPISFALAGVTLPTKLIASVAFNTTHYGSAPQGQGAACFSSSGGCGYDSLNVGTELAPTVGSNPQPDDAYLKDAFAANYCDGGTGGTNIFRLDGGCWTGIQPAFRVAAFPTSSPNPGRISDDFDGDARSDIGVYRRSTGQWFIALSGIPGSSLLATFGAPASSGLGDRPVPADYDGDGRADLAIYRAATGEWFISGSLGVFRTATFGAPASSGLGDIPVPADYDGDGKADLAIYRPATGQWFIFGSATGFRTTTFGAPASGGPGDIPVPGDYDGDGKADLAIYRPATGQWFIFGSATGFRTTTFGAPASSGLGDIPVPADYDDDGQADLAIYRSATGQWLLFGSAVGFRSISWGAPSASGAGDIPVPKDYDGDGRADVAVFRAATGEWFILRSSDGGTTSLAWGAPASSGLGDIPLP